MSSSAGKNVGACDCKAFCDEVKEEMWKVLSSLQERLIRKSGEYEEGGGSNEEFVGYGKKRRRPGVVVESPGNVFKKRRVSTESIILQRNLREQACQEIASFFYNNAIPFDAVKSDEFRRMLEAVARHGIGFEPPSYREIGGQYLRQKVYLTLDILEEHRAYWKKTGCTIMINEWTNKEKRTVLNFLVNSPKGTFFFKYVDVSRISLTAEKIFEMMDDIVYDVGEENVIQVITKYAAHYKAAGEILMERRKRLYWTPCAAHCIGLMLEDFEKKVPFHEETIANGKKIVTYVYSRTSLISLLRHFNRGKNLAGPAVTRFAMAYLTLGFLYDNKRALIRMFRSNEWKSNQYAETKDGKLVENVVMDEGFWKNVVICLKGAYPLIKVLRLVDSNEKQAMGFIYQEMNWAKKKIQSAFNSIKESYTPLWDIIDERWHNQLYSPLHATGYYLNPRLHYSPEFKADFKVKQGLYNCLERIVECCEEMLEIDLHLEDFKSRSKSFGGVVAKNGIYAKAPTQWWDSYGNEHPKLQNFAMCVLSLPCSSAKCEHIWSAFESVHTRRRNHLKQNTRNDVFFVMANSKLAKKKQVRKANDYNIDDLSSNDDWIIDNDGNFKSLNWDLNIPNEEDLIEVGEYASDAVGAPIDDLEIANFDDDELDVDHIEDDDYDHDLNDLLDY